jgi:hypothetical protein
VGFCGAVSFAGDAWADRTAWQHRNPLPSKTNALSGPAPFDAHSNTSMASTTCQSSAGMLCLDAANSAGWSGSDPGAWINAAYASLPSNGGHIRIIPGGYTFSTGVLIGTAGKPAEIDCEPGSMHYERRPLFGMRGRGGSSRKVSERMALYLEGKTPLSAMFFPSRRQPNESRH